MRCFQQQSRGFSSLPQPIRRHEALKNDVESGGVKRAFVDRLSPVFVPRTTFRDEGNASHYYFRYKTKFFFTFENIFVNVIIG